MFLLILDVPMAFIGLIGVGGGSFLTVLALDYSSPKPTIWFRRRDSSLAISLSGSFTMLLAVSFSALGIYTIDLLRIFIYFSWLFWDYRWNSKSLSHSSANSDVSKVNFQCFCSLLKWKTNSIVGERASWMTEVVKRKVN